jgi:hypothetical protein
VEVKAPPDGIVTRLELLLDVVVLAQHSLIAAGQILPDHVQGLVGGVRPELDLAELVCTLLQLVAPADHVDREPVVEATGAGTELALDPHQLLVLASPDPGQLLEVEWPVGGPQLLAIPGLVERGGAVVWS